jgi:hypothetical protein
LNLFNDDLEPHAAALVGQLVFSFARLDFHLALALRNILAAAKADDLNPLIERLGFKEKLDALREVLSTKGSEYAKAAAEYEVWYASADKLRVTRNAFVHGRWGVQSEDMVFNAAPRFGKAMSGSSKHFSLADLTEEVSRAREVLEQFHQWHSHHVMRVASFQQPDA